MMDLQCCSSEQVENSVLRVLSKRAASALVDFVLGVLSIKLQVTLTVKEAALAALYAQKKSQNTSWE